MSIIGHLREVTAGELHEFDSDPAAAYRLILGDSLSAARSTSEEVIEWKKKNADNLLQVIAAGNPEKLSPENRLVFEKAHLEFGNIARRSVLQAIAATRKVPKSKPGLSLEKSWHGIHYLLTGTVDGGVPPLSWAILGDKEVPDREKLMGYGPAHSLTPHHVNEVRKALSRTTQEEFRCKFDLKAMQAAKIYAVNNSSDFECLWSYFKKLKSFYLQAAKRRNGLLIYLD